MAVRRNGHHRTRAHQAELQASAGQVVDSLKELGDEARSMASQQVEQTREMAAEYWEDGRRRVSDWEESLEEMIREQPVKSMAIAVGAGFVLGFLFRRR